MLINFKNFEHVLKIYIRKPQQKYKNKYLHKGISNQKKKKKDIINK